MEKVNNKERFVDIACETSSKTPRSVYRIWQLKELVKSNDIDTGSAVGIFLVNNLYKKIYEE